MKEGGPEGAPLAQLDSKTGVYAFHMAPAA
jgi:hypothetical protein